MWLCFLAGSINVDVHRFYITMVTIVLRWPLPTCRVMIYIELAQYVYLAHGKAICTTGSHVTYRITVRPTSATNETSGWHELESYHPGKTCEFQAEVEPP